MATLKLAVPSGAIQPIAATILGDIYTPTERAKVQGLVSSVFGIAAVIGPTISQTAYEVGPEFFETFTDDNRDAARFFANGKGDRMLFDLPAYGLSRLRAAGVGHAEWTRHCTYADPARFYSFRRTTHAGEADYGRLISVIRL